ncbi:hypothetical protein KM043_014013 [Ampulex compressa]|nr:hypothetical protein KM043_014013 [Ampulex compressa]
MTIATAVDTFYIIIVLHTCGLFDLVGMHLTCAFDCCGRNKCDRCINCKSFEKIVNATLHHKKAMRYTCEINSCYAVSYLIQLVIIVTIFSVLLFCLFHAVTVSKDVEKIVMYGFHSAGLPFLVFLNVIPAQELIDHSIHVFHDAYVFNIVSSGFNFVVITEAIPIILTAVICFVKYTTVCFRDNVIRSLFDSMKHDWDTLIKDDKDILWRSVGKSKRYVWFFIGSTYVLLVAYLMSPLLPYALELIAPSNNSHSHDHPLIMIYSYQKSSYIFYLSLLHIYASVFYVMTVILAVDTSYIIIVLHVCGLFDLIGARFSYAFECCGQSACGASKNCSSLKKVICATIYHKRAIRCLHQAITVSKDMDKVLMYGSHSIGLPFLVFLNIVPAQELLDHSVDVFYKVYVI